MSPVIELVGPKGYVHGWHFVGIAGARPEVAQHIRAAEKAASEGRTADAASHLKAAQHHAVNKDLKRSIGRAHGSLLRDKAAPAKASPQPRAAAPKAPAAPETAGAKLSPAAYEALQPRKTGWTPVTPRETEARLKQEPGGADLVRVLHSIQDGPAAAIPRMRSDIEKLSSGGELQPGRERAVRGLLDAIAGSDVSGKHLYRGMRVTGRPQDVAARYSRGSSVDISLGSFTSDRSVASGFASGARLAGQRSRTGSTPVVVRWEDGSKRALPLQNLASVKKVAQEREYLASGHFRVIDVKTAGGTVVVSIEQVKPL